MQNTTYQFTTPLQSPSEISVTEILGMHVLPTIQNNWLDTLSHKAFIGWLQLLSLAIYEDNRAREGEIVRYPTKKEILKKLNMSESTFNRTIMKPLFEYGLLTIEDVPGTEKLNKRGLPNRRIIVYRYPLNQKENQLKPLVKLYDYETDYNSKAKTFGIMGAIEKKKLQIEDEYMKQYDAQNGSNFIPEPVDKDAFNSESNTYPQAFISETLSEGVAFNSESNDSDKGLEDHKLSKLKALNIYNNTSSNNKLNNSFKEREKLINNNSKDNIDMYYNIMHKREENSVITQEQQDIYSFMNLPKDFLSEAMQQFVERLVELNLDYETIQSIVMDVIVANKQYGESIAIESANEQIDFMLEEIKKGKPIHHFPTFFSIGYKSKINTNLIKIQQMKQQVTEMKKEILEAKQSTESGTTKKYPGLYNWLEERED